MERIEKTVFISYRRTNISWALAVYQNLKPYGYDVFIDVKGIASGDFEQVIIGNIKARAHFLVLLTPSALVRCADPGDLLRREIETALATRRNIVPLMLEGFDFDAPGITSGLTGELANLKKYNALPIPVAYFDEAMRRLREEYLNVPLDAVLHPASPYAQQAAKEQQVAAGAAPAVSEKELTVQEWRERGLRDTDQHVLRIACELSIGEDSDVLAPNAVAARAEGLGISQNQVIESIRILEEEGLLAVSNALGKYAIHFRIAAAGFDLYCRSEVEHYDSIVRAVASEILNKGEHNSLRISRTLGQPRLIVNQIMNQFVGQGFCKKSREIGTHVSVYDISPRFRRAFEGKLTP